MSIAERIKKIEPYFKEMQIITVEKEPVIYVVVEFPYEWVIDEELEPKFNITISKGEHSGEFYFCSEIKNGEENVFDAIEYNIGKMKEAIERAQLLSEKTKALKQLFEDESVSILQLRKLKFVYDEETVVVPKKNKGKEENEVKNE